MAGPTTCASRQIWTLALLTLWSLLLTATFGREVRAERLSPPDPSKGPCCSFVRKYVHCASPLCARSLPRRWNMDTTVFNLTSAPKELQPHWIRHVRYFSPFACLASPGQTGGRLSSPTWSPLGSSEVKVRQERNFRGISFRASLVDSGGWLCVPARIASRPLPSGIHGLFLLFVAAVRFLSLHLFRISEMGVRSWWSGTPVLTRVAFSQ